MAVKCSSRTLWTTADEDGYPYWVEFEDRPFTKGNSKFMYKGRLNGKGPRSGDYCALKVFRTIDIATHEDWTAYISRIERANKLAAQFNKLIDNQYKVKFLVPMTALVDISSTCTDCIYFLSNTKRIRSDDCVAVEPYIGHKFRKFYRNSPLKGAEHAYILQAFSHFTASQTGDTLICGLQGVAQGTEFILTNPIIHSANQEWGPKDQGPQGFRKFFSAHTCNDICRSMDLPEYLETMSVTEEIEKDVVEGVTSEEVLEAPIVSEEVSQVAESVPEAEAQIAEVIKETPAILQTPPMSRVGRTIIAPVSVEMTVSRTSSVTGPPEFAEDLPGESVSRPSAESEILDATPIDDIAPPLSGSQEVLPPPSSEYTPCRTVEEYLELKKSCASFSPGSEMIPMIDDELACAESEMRDVLPPPTDDFEPTISPSINSYMKDKESLEIIDPDLESQPSISVFDDIPAADLGSMTNFQMTPRESVTRDAEVFESLENTPCRTESQESLVTTPCGSILQELDSQPSVDTTPKDSVSQDLIPVSEPPLEADLHLDLQEGTEAPHDIESRVCLVSIPPDCMDHHLERLESLEALSPASEKLRSVELGEECVEPGADQVVEEQVSAQEFSETQTTQETSAEGLETFPLDNVEVEVHKSECEDAMSDFKQSLETIPEGSTESENENVAPEVSTEVEAEEAADDVAADGTVVEKQIVETTDASGQEETVVEEVSEVPCEAAPEAVVSEETVVESGSEGVTVEPATEVPAEGAATVCEETTVEATVSEETTVEATAEPVGEATVSQETTVETTAEPTGEATVSDETTVEATAEPTGEATVSEETTVEATAEPVGEATVSQETTAETTAEPTGEATVSEETTAEPTGESTVSKETTVETTAEPAGEAVISQETTVETIAEPAEEAVVSQETTVETIAEPAGEAVVSQETTVETIAEPAGEAVVSQETAVETIAEPAGEAVVSQQTTVETTAEPAGEATVSEETTVEATAEEATVYQETTVETTAEPAGETTVSQETTVEPSGEATVSHETTVETTAEPAVEAAVTQETTAEPAVEATVSQETTVEPAVEATVSQETTVEATAEPAGEATVSQETTVETTAEPAVEATVSQETTPEPAVEATVSQETTPEPAVEATVSQETTVETTAEPDVEATVSQETTVEPVGEAAVPQETTVETGSESNVNQEPAMESNETTGECHVSQEVTEPTAPETAMGDANVSQDIETTEEANVSQEIAFETTGVSSQDLVVESTNEMPGEGFGTIREGYVCPDSAVETTVEGSNVMETTECGYVSQESDFGPTGDGYMSQNTEFESNVESTADGYTSQDSGFGYSNQDQSFPVTYDSDPGSNTCTPVSSSYPTKAINTITSQVPDTYYYGVPPEYRISENCDSSLCEPGCPQRFTKMTIVPDLDTMEYVETKCLDPVYEEQDNQQGIETLPRRRVSYYLEPQESHEIITFRINISPELPRPGQKSGDCVYQNVGTPCSSNQGESSRSSNYCPNCQPREISENIVETSGQDTERPATFYSYHYTDVSDCTESMPQRSCGYSTEVHQNMPSDWSPTHSNWDDGQCSTGQNLPRTQGEKVDSKFGPSV